MPREEWIAVMLIDGGEQVPLDRDPRAGPSGMRSAPASSGDEARRDLGSRGLAAVRWEERITPALRRRELRWPPGHGRYFMMFGDRRSSAACLHDGKTSERTCRSDMSGTCSPPPADPEAGRLLAEVGRCDYLEKTIQALLGASIQWLGFACVTLPGSSRRTRQFTGCISLLVLLPRPRTRAHRRGHPLL